MNLAEKLLGPNTDLAALVTDLLARLPDTDAVTPELWNKALLDPARDILSRSGKGLRARLMERCWRLAGGDPAGPPETLPVLIELLPELAPDHVARIKELVREGFYDGIVFHRVIDGFMAQTGDPTGTGRGGSSKPDLKAEFSAEPFVRGVIGMARTQAPNSANSQWFICLDDARFLDGQYTVSAANDNIVDQIAVDISQSHRS